MTDAVEYTGSISITQPKPDYHVTFTQGEKTIGRLDFNGDEMTFTGDADASAKKFMEFLSSYFAQRLKEEREKERELCAKVCEGFPMPNGILGAHPEYLNGKRMAVTQCAESIRARGDKND